MVNPCCIKFACCKGKVANAQDKKDEAEWFEPIRRKSKNQQQASADVPGDNGDDVTQDTNTPGTGATTNSPRENARPKRIPSLGECIDEPEPPLALTAETDSTKSSDLRGDVRPKRRSAPRLSVSSDAFLKGVNKPQLTTRSVSAPPLPETREELDPRASFSDKSESAVLATILSESQDSLSGNDDGKDNNDDAHIAAPKSSNKWEGPTEDINEDDNDDFLEEGHRTVRMSVAEKRMSNCNIDSFLSEDDLKLIDLSEGDREVYI